MDNNCEKLNSYFSAKKSLYHYLHMAENNNREFLRDDIVKLKKYFYVLRPILACKWILEHKSQPPMQFKRLVDAQLPDYIRDEVDELLERKINAPEIKNIKRVEKINDYIEHSITEIKQSLDTILPEKDKDWNELNEIFLSELHC